jgi:hypothetical protein
MIEKVVRESVEVEAAYIPRNGRVAVSGRSCLDETRSKFGPERVGSLAV